MLSEPLSLQHHQACFTSYVRSPDTSPLPAGLKPERMAMYAELIFNNVESFLSSNFPVIKKILSETQWIALVRDFFVDHSAKTPYFSEIPEEFLTYLQDERQNAADYPFLLELAHYEWVEMALSIAQEELPTLSPVKNLLHESVQLSPLAWLLAYQFPVHQISPDFLPIETPLQPTFLVVYRNADYEVRFMALNPMTYRLLQFIQAGSGHQAAEHLQQMAAEMPQYDCEVVINGGLQTLCELYEKQVILVVNCA